MTGSTTHDRVRLGQDRTHGAFPNRRGEQQVRVNTARRQRFFGAGMVILVIIGGLIINYAFGLGSHPCLETVTNPLDGSMQACHNEDDALLGRQVIIGAVGATLILWSLRRLWKGV